MLKEYGPELRYIKGEHNIVADALSRLDMVPELRESKASKWRMMKLPCYLPLTKMTTQLNKFPLSYQEIENRQKVNEAATREIRAVQTDQIRLWRHPILTGHT
jgi:hypothetical protein